MISRRLPMLVQLFEILNQVVDALRVEELLLSDTFTSQNRSPHLANDL